MASVEFLQPWWLLLLGTLPLFWLLGRRNLGSRRRWLSLGLRCLLVACLVAALAEPRLAIPYKNTTVLFVLDRSLSVPEEPDADGQDRRWLRLRGFINDSVRQRPAGRERDKVGLIVFGRRPRLELLPGDAPRFNLTEITSPIDGHATDIAAALQLALATFPEGSARRIVLLSDGNENRGNAAELATLARLNGVQIDVVPLAAGHHNDSEVLVERVEAPLTIEQGGQLPLKVWVRSYSRRPVVGTLTVKQIGEDRTVLVEEPPPRVTLQLGLNSFSFRQPLAGEQRSYTYEAEFHPEGILDERGRLAVRGLPGDRVQNNRASTHVVARGRRRVLLLEAEAGEHRELVERLRAAGAARFSVEARSVDFLDRYQDRDRLAAFLSNFDCVILANVAADMVSEEQQEVLRANTHDQGCGLVMIGGPQAYGAGGWQNTPVEQALPVSMDVPNQLHRLASSIVVALDRSGSMSAPVGGGRVKMDLANAGTARIVDLLGPADELGVLAVDTVAHTIAPLGRVTDKGALRGRIRGIRSMGGGIFVYEALEKAAAMLAGARGATKHIILFADAADAEEPGNYKALVKKCRAARITISVIGLGTRKDKDAGLLEDVARRGKGRCSFAARPEELPALFVRETRLLGSSFVWEKPFEPLLRFRAGPTAGLPPRLPDLRGFVRTTLKPGPLVEAPIKSPRQAGVDYPILAYWPYGLGKAVAFTSDAGRPKLWCAGWAAAPLYGKFWEQVIDWSLRPVEGKNLVMTSDCRDGRIRVVVEARTEAGEPDLSLRDLRAEVTPPRVGPDAPQRPLLKFEQKSGGVYEAECAAEEAGSYFIAFQATRKLIRGGKEVRQRESVRGSVTIPYAPEFADMESNPDLLERLREETGGESYADEDDELARVAAAGTVFRPGSPGYTAQQAVWYWLVFLAAVLLLLEVAVRRLALTWAEVTQPLRWLWRQLRGRQAEVAGPQFLDRLKSRKAQVNEELATRRFEASAAPLPPPSEAAEAKPTAAPSEVETEPTDYASRLLRAKKRIWEQRDDKQ